MKDKLNQLFTSARKSAPDCASENFAESVMRQIHLQSRIAGMRTEESLLDQLNYLFPRLATLSAVVILLSFALDYGLTSVGVPDLTAGTSQITSEILFDAGGW